MDQVIRFTDCDHCRGTGLVAARDEDRQCAKCLNRWTAIKAQRARQPRWYLADAGRGYAVVDDNGDGEYDYFPTLTEAQDALNRRLSGDSRP
jgi:hypothetical protein